jgi:hypothetical protein
VGRGRPSAAGTQQPRPGLSCLGRRPQSGSETPRPHSESRESIVVLARATTELGWPIRQPTRHCHRNKPTLGGVGPLASNLRERRSGEPGAHHTPPLHAPQILNKNGKTRRGRPGWGWETERGIGRQPSEAVHALHLSCRAFATTSRHRRPAVQNQDCEAR